MVYCFILQRSSLPAWPSREPSDLSGLESDGPLELLMATTSWQFSLPSDYLENLFVLSGLDSDSPPWLSYIFPLEFPPEIHFEGGH
jgi:hypothetical protein